MLPVPRPPRAARPCATNRRPISWIGHDARHSGGCDQCPRGLILSVLSLGIAAIAHAGAVQPISTIGRAEGYTPAHDRPRPRMKRDLPSATLDAGAVAQRIREALRAGHWPPGSRLPTERAMAESLGLSRAAVRKALAALKTEGLISQRVGSGTYANAPLPSMAQIGPAELMRARIAFEPQIAELAVHN